MPRMNYAYRRSQANIVHWSGKDLIEQQEKQAAAHAAQRERLVAQHAARVASRFAATPPPAAWLYRRPVAGAGLALVGLAVVAQVLGAGWPLWLMLALLAVPFVLDGWNLRTLHGRINWPLFRFDHPALFWLAAAGLVVTAYPSAFVWPAWYVVQALQYAPDVREAGRVRLQAEVARLEAALHPELSPEGQAPSAASAEPSQP